MNPIAETITDLARFIEPDQVAELRALHVGQRGRTYAGWFDGRNLNEMARWALNLSREAAGVYFTPNPVASELLTRSPNTVSEIRRDGIKLTTDRDILIRQWVIIDLDPVRVGQGVSQDDPTTEAELQAARGLATDVVIPMMRQHGWTDPIECMSGNGVHLVYRLRESMLNRDFKLIAADPVVLLLEEISKRNSTAAVKIDPNTGNASRMLKVPGTFSRKGNPSPGRPWRVAKVMLAGDSPTESKPRRERINA